MLHRVVSNEIREKAKNELNETPIKREETSKEIEKWLNAYPHIRIRRDNLWMLNFMRGCEFKAQEIQQMLTAYSKLEEVVPELVSHRDPLSSELQHIIESGIMILFGTPDVDCLIFRWEKVDTSQITLDSLLKVGLMLYEICLNESETMMIVGKSLIIDCKGFGILCLRHYPLITIKKLLHYIFTSYPMRVRHLSFINCSTLIYTAFNVFRPFFPRNIQSKIRLYGTNYMDIYNKIPQHYFPREYGGSNSSINDIIVEWKTKFESYRNWFLESK